MPPTLQQKEISSISEYMTFIEGQTDIRWYRGVGDDKNTLLPSLYRHPKTKDSNSLLKNEVEILKRFKQRSVPYLSAPLKENDKDLTTLFLMQHFGVPTRLLDWTENPYLALFFALTDAQYRKTRKAAVYKTNAVVWVLRPIEWNNKILNLTVPPGIISPPDDDNLNGYLPVDIIKYGKTEPVAIYGIHNSPRIVAQKGVFTLFGAGVVPMEKVYIDKDLPQDSLFKLLIRKERIGDLLQALIRIGITDSVVYPDLQGLAAEIKRQFGYWV